MAAKQLEQVAEAEDDEDESKSSAMSYEEHQILDFNLNQD